MQHARCTAHDAFIQLELKKLQLQRFPLSAVDASLPRLEYGGSALSSSTPHTLEDKDSIASNYSAAVTLRIELPHR